MYGWIVQLVCPGRWRSNRNTSCSQYPWPDLYGMRLFCFDPFAAHACLPYHPKNCSSIDIIVTFSVPTLWVHALRVMRAREASSNTRI
jgi:hypothetical protein